MQKLRFAKSLVGEDNAHLALSLVGGEKEIQNALEYVFGNTIVCKDMSDANKVNQLYQVSQTETHFHLLIRRAKQFVLLITSFDSIAFIWNLLKLRALFVPF